MNVAVIGTRGFPNIQGGVEKHCESLYPLIAEKEPKIKLTVFRRKPYVTENTSAPFEHSIQFMDLWTIRNKYLETLVHSFQAAVICLFKRPDLVHIHNIGPALVLPLLKLAGLKVLVTYHSDNYNHEKWGIVAKKILKAGEWLVGRMADRVIVVSKRQLALFDDKSRVINIPNGVTISVPSTSAETISAHGVLPGQYILAVARFVPEKGLDLLVKAFKLYTGDLKLVIAGDADHETAYSRDLKQQMAGDSRIIGTGYITGDRLTLLFSNARLFVLPSRHEGLPIALLEALGYGLPVLASDIPANRELELPDERYFKSGNIEDLLYKLENIADIMIPQEEKESQKKRISESYDWNSVAEKTLDVYKEMFFPFMSMGSNFIKK
ncbi:MAG: glycosyltransferase family 4 protein [Desulfobacteraceae bacterium]|jgi:glycosyltransferase involved in cell wall biosynthesis